MKSIGKLTCGIFKSKLGERFADRSGQLFRSTYSVSSIFTEEGTCWSQSLICECYEDSSNRRITELDKLLRRFDTNSTTCQEGGTYAGNLEKCLKLAEKVQATQRMAGLKRSVFC